MENLIALYGEVAPKFNKLESCISEVDQEISKLKRELKQVDYDIEAMKSIAISNIALERVKEDVKKEFEAYKATLNEKDALYEKIRKALLEDVENEKQQLRPLFEQISEINRELIKMDSDFKLNREGFREKSKEPLEKIKGLKMLINQKQQEKVEEYKNYLEGFIKMVNFNRQKYVKELVNYIRF